MSTLYSSTTPDDGVIRLQFNDDYGDDGSYSLWYHGERVWSSADILPSCDNPAGFASVVHTGLYNANIGFASAGVVVDHGETIEPSIGEKYNRLGMAVVFVIVVLIFWAPSLAWLWQWLS